MKVKQLTIGIKSAEKSLKEFTHGLIELEQSREGREKTVPQVEYNMLRFEIAV